MEGEDAGLAGLDSFGIHVIPAWPPSAADRAAVGVVEKYEPVVVVEGEDEVEDVAVKVGQQGGVA